MTQLTLSDLRARQANPLHQKIDHTVGAIEAFVNFCKEHSAPLSIWTDADCWAYIRRFDVPYSSIYDVPGIKRTGCMFCGFGAQMKGDCRFSVLYDLHPKVYHMAMDYTNNGYTLRHALRRMGVYLPDETQKLF